MDLPGLCALTCKRRIVASSTVAVRLWLIVLLLTCQPAMAGQRVLLIRGLMDYLPGISPMGSLQTRLTSEGFDVTMITHLIDGFYRNTYWDAVIGHSQGAIDALRDAPELARYLFRGGAGTGPRGTFPTPRRGAAARPQPPEAAGAAAQAVKPQKPTGGFVGPGPGI